MGGEPELALLLQIFPEGVEELDGAYAVYADEPPLGFDVVEIDDVAEDWADAWRAFHHGVRIGRCWVGPPWEERPADAVAVVIDPGRAFGTGGHATTRLCLELLQEAEPTSLLDVVERLLPELPVERAITSGYLARDEPRVEGWHQLKRRVRDGWAADLLRRTS